MFVMLIDSRPHHMALTIRRGCFNIGDVFPAQNFPLLMENCLTFNHKLQKAFDA